MRTKRAHAPQVLSAGTSIEVRCHLNCPWSPGFEVEEVVLVDDGVNYRIRRAESGWALPTPFGADYVRRHGRASPQTDTYPVSRDFAVSRRPRPGGPGTRELDRPST